MEVWLSRERESEGTACVVVVSGTRFESFFLFARTATHVQARESEGTACVVVVSGTQFEFFVCLFARTATHLWVGNYWHALVIINKHRKIIYN